MSLGRRAGCIGFHPDAAVVYVDSSHSNFQSKQQGPRFKPGCAHQAFQALSDLADAKTKPRFPPRLQRCGPRRWTKRCSQTRTRHCTLDPINRQDPAPCGARPYLTWAFGALEPKCVSASNVRLRLKLSSLRQLISGFPTWHIPPIGSSRRPRRRP
jgi:hypothetical protein